LGTGHKIAAYCHTFVGVNLEIELGKEQLAEVEQANVHVTAVKDI
jgi:hypothetical protein